MGRFNHNINEVDRHIVRLQQEQELKAQKLKAKNEQELKRRRLYAELYEPHKCLYPSPDGEPCTRFAIPGGYMCIRHGGNTHEAREAAKMRLLALVEPALKALNRALASNDLKIAAMAAAIILDRSGFRPGDVMVAEEQTQDLSKMTKAELTARAQATLDRIHQLDADRLTQTEPDQELLAERTETEDSGSIH